MVVMEEAVVEGAAASEDVNLVELMNARARSYGMLARLFREEADVREIIKFKAVYELLEIITDRCEDVANIIEGIVLENS